VLGCGGLITRAIQSGHVVSVLFLTDGSASHPGHPELDTKSLAVLRRREAREAAAVLGLAADRLAFLDLPDGTLPRLSADARAHAVRQIADYLQSIHPATILAAYRHDGSSEHEAAFSLLTEAIHDSAAPARLLEYLVWTAYSPRLLGRLLIAQGRVFCSRHDDLGPVKSRALSAYRSQFLPSPPWPEPVQPADFANAFSPETEFFIELSSQ
jgi:LmbE family N-acetylglucosaminyl deacetylase